MPNTVYIATSLDGYITDRNGGLEWLSRVPNPDGDDLGFADFMTQIDAVVMGRTTFEAVQGFGIGWPYPKPGIVLSRTLSDVPKGFEDHVTLMRGKPADIVEKADALGHKNLYIDGGATIRRFLDADLIDEMILTEIPILLGGGTRLFDLLDTELAFELDHVEILLRQMVKRHYRRDRS
ncbi:dihydrofolate reductase family protein [uncultured Pelagimonas sp.]|uniref:dihydrofolate reductase family protein n=1 Tax=uncultured Pelagimonas sp. TaxID=1618102 RepID=UPI002624FBDE|nr:dihydrofolate reductase family protein [uncultured Pelagimonas sp.]